MRWILGLVALLIVLLVVLSLQARSTGRSVIMTTRAIAPLQENITPVPFDATAALRLADRLKALATTRELPRSELETAAATAAGWARSSAPGGGASRAAVRLRGAANALLDASPDLADPRREEALRLLAEARAALASQAPLPSGPAGGIKDQLDNLQRSLDEQRRQVEREAQ